MSRNFLIVDPEDGIDVLKAFASPARIAILKLLHDDGALRGIEHDPNTPAQVQRLCRIARLGTFQPRQPDYAGAFQAIGPAAIKLGQTLATRPDVVGEEAAQNLLSLQDSLPPVPFAAIRREIETSFGKPLETMFSSIEEVPVGAASIAQVHRAVTTDGRTVAIKVLPAAMSCAATRQSTGSVTRMFCFSMFWT